VEDAVGALSLDADPVAGHGNGELAQKGIRRVVQEKSLEELERELQDVETRIEDAQRVAGVGAGQPLQGEAPVPPPEQVEAFEQLAALWLKRDAISKAYYRVLARKDK
jgi:hypothetical protein